MTNPCSRPLFPVFLGNAMAASTIPETEREVSKTDVLSDYSWKKRPLLQANFKDSTDARSLAKPVLASQLVDDMESQREWTASPAVQLEFTDERAKEGNRSLRFQATQRPEDYIKSNRSANGSYTGNAPLFEFMPEAASVHLKLDPPQDWSAFNRISLWCYLHPTDNPINAISIQFLSNGAPAGSLDPPPVHYIQDLKPGEWNHLTWEIPEYQRGKVSEFVIFMPVWGVSKEGQDPMFVCDFDELRVELVAADYYEGWEVAPGRISFNHAGYLPAGEKQAFAGETGINTFQVVSATTGKEAAAFSAKLVTNKRGKYRVLDFSSFTKPGEYFLEYGNMKTQPFTISENILLDVLEKNLNGLYGMRCGFDIPEMHDACHLDAITVYNGEKHPIAGGWHDAGNLSEGAHQSLLTTLYLLSAYDVLKGRLPDKSLEEKLLDEALWGLDWIMKTSFGNGIRLLRAPYSVYTDNKIGTIDDIVSESVGNDPFTNIISAGVKSYASRLLKSMNSGFSALLLDSAAEDFAAYIEARKQPPGAEVGFGGMNQGTWKDEMGYGSFAAIQMYLVTGEEKYKGHAVRFGRDLLAQQEQTFVDGIPVTGYFYTDPQREHIVQDFHSSFEESGLFAFKALCEALPDHSDWIKWYAGSLLYSEYFLRQGSKITEPYGLIPAAVYRLEDLDVLESRMPWHMFGSRTFKPTPGTTSLITPEDYNTQKLRMLREGIRLSGNHWLRAFPIWPDQYRHGNTNIQLSMTAGLIASAQLRGQRTLSEMVRRQLQWILGGNPFSKSLMYGVGYDYQQLLVIALPNIVGSVPVGMNSLYNDAPYWPSNTIYPHKEIWIMPTGRMTYSLALAGAPARVSGASTDGVLFREERTGNAIKFEAGSFEKSIPAGEYEISYSGFKKRVSMVGGERYRLMLDPKNTIEFELSSTPCREGKVTVQARVNGTGDHTVELRIFNGSTKNRKRNVRLVSGSIQTISWDVTIENSDTPWVVVAVPDGNIDGCKELFNTVTALREIE